MSLPDPALLSEFDHRLAVYEAAGQALAPLAQHVALEILAAALPGANTIEVHGSINEDWLRVLRVRRVLADDGVVLFDVTEGHDDSTVEAAIDEANTEYLDLLMDLTGDAYLGLHQLDLRSGNPDRRSM